MTIVPNDSFLMPGLSKNGLPNIEWCLEIPPGDYPVSSADSQSWLRSSQEIFMLKYPFRLAKYPINQAQFYVFMRDTQVRKETPDHIVPLNRPKAARGGIWWSDAFVFARWLNQKYHEAGLLDENWHIDVPNEIEWGLTARYPDAKLWRPTREQLLASPFDGMREVNPDTGMHLAFGFFREWCVPRSWHSCKGPDVEVDIVLQDRGSYLHMMNYITLRGVLPTFQMPMAPTWDNDIGMRVVCRPTT